MEQSVIPFLIKNLEKAFNVYKQRLENCRASFSEEAVHDFRVSIRRFLALLLLIKKLIDTYYIDQLVREIKKQLKFMNPLRDTQVQIISVRNLSYQFPVLFSFSMYLSTKEQSLIGNLKLKIDKISIYDIEGLFFFLKIFLKQQVSGRKSLINDNLLNIARVAYDEVKIKASDLIREDLDTIHQLRLAFKRFRYVAEFLSDRLSFKDKDFKKMKNLQNILGSIQDSRVLLSEINEYMFELNDPALTGLYTQVLETITEERNFFIDKLYEHIILLEDFRIIPSN